MSSAPAPDNKNGEREPPQNWLRKARAFALIVFLATNFWMMWDTNRRNREVLARQREVNRLLELSQSVLDDAKAQNKEAERLYQDTTSLAGRALTGCKK